MKKYSGFALALVITISGITMLGYDAYMKAKAATASRLIDTAWHNHLKDGQVHYPWPWADFFPVGQLEVPRLEIMQTILSDASGQSMAFGLGLVPGTALPGAGGNVVLAGHRDSHAGFLAQIKQGDTVILHSGESSTAYEIAGSRVVQADNTSALTQEGPDRLTLVTCFPFGGLTPTDQRYVLTGFRLPLDSPTVWQY